MWVQVPSSAPTKKEVTHVTSFNYLLLLLHIPLHFCFCAIEQVFAFGHPIHFTPFFFSLMTYATAQPTITIRTAIINILSIFLTYFNFIFSLHFAYLCLFVSTNTKCNKDCNKNCNCYKSAKKSFA